MKTLLISAAVALGVAGWSGRAEARDHCGHGHSSHHSGHHYSGHHHHGYSGYHNSCSSFGVGFGSYYHRPYYSSYYSGYPGYGYGYGYPSYSSYAYSYPAYSYYRPPVYSSRVYYQPRARSYSTEASVQVALARKGYYHGAIDGIFGPASRSALRRYQLNRGLDVSGAIDYPTMRMLAIR